MKPDPRPVFNIRLRAESGDGVAALKAVLKTALRRHNLKCIEAFEVNSGRILEELQAAPGREEVQYVLEQYDALIRKLAEPEHEGLLTRAQDAIAELDDARTEHSEKSDDRTA
jgi:hypothetical protein